MNSTEIRAYKCEKCGCSFINEVYAELCCKPKHCKDCGTELPHNWYSIICEPCRQSLEFKNGKVLTFDEFLQSEYKDNMVYYNDTYYLDIDDCLQSILDCEIEDVKYIKVTTKITHKLDSDSLIEHLECEANCEDDVCVDEKGVKELENFLKVWNEKYKLITYCETNVYIEIDDKIKEEYR